MGKYSVYDYPYEMRNELVDGEKAFVCRFRDFPHIIGVGDTQDEALADGREALESIIDYEVEEGHQLPEPSVTEAVTASGRLTIRMPKSLHQRLIQRAEDDDASLNTIVCNALENYLRPQKSKILEKYSFVSLIQNLNEMVDEEARLFSSKTIDTYKSNIFSNKVSETTKIDMSGNILSRVANA